MPELTPEVIAEQALEGRRSETDRQVSEAHSLKELVEAAKFEKANQPGTTPRAGMRLIRVIPPGAA